MSDPVLSRHLAAERIAAEAAILALRHFHGRSALAIEAKANLQDVVSRADREVEDLIRSRVARLFPDDGILGEEGGDQAGTSGFTWVVDPIDGTSPFLAGLPHWCIAIAVLQDRETVLGVTNVPMAKEVFSARKGAGLTLNGRLSRLDHKLRIDNCLTGIGASHRSKPEDIAEVMRLLLEAGGAFYRNGSGAAMLASVAAGRLGAYLELHMNAWDCLGGLLMVREAGGVTEPFCEDGDLSGGDRVVAAAPGVWPGIEGLLVAYEAESDMSQQAVR